MSNIPFSWTVIKHTRRAWQATVHGVAKKPDTTWRLNNHNKNITIKVPVLSQMIYQFYTIFVKIPASSFVETDKLILKFI